MLVSPMAEGISGVVAIHHIASGVFKALLRYLYIGTAVVGHAQLMLLLAAANQWQLDHLRFLCEEKMIRHLSLANVLEVGSSRLPFAPCSSRLRDSIPRRTSRLTLPKTLMKAEKYRAPFLFDACRELAEKHVDELCSTPEWASLPPDLASRLKG